MKKKYLLVLGIVFFKMHAFYAQTVSFPYQNDLKGPSPADVVGVGTNQIFTENGIQLTDSNLFRSGAVVLNDVSFTSDQGLTIEFEYDMYGGIDFYGNYADGLCLFLYDATAPLQNLPGFAAGALAYNYNRAPDILHPGLNKAYLAVALDQFGNFRRPGTAIGINQNFVQNASTITLRGAMRQNAIGADALTIDGQPTSYISNNPLIYNDLRFQGYPVLFSRNTTYIGSEITIKGQYLNMEDNSITNVTYTDIRNNLSSKINIRGGELNPSPTSLNYRKVIITLGPADPALGGGYYITLDLQNGINNVRIVDAYHYKESFFYIENADSNATSEAFPLELSKIYSLDASVPAEFKIGFGAATGGASQFHLIKNLVVDLAYVPRFEPDYVVFCENVAEPTKAVVDVFANDFVYNGPIYGPPIEGNGPDNIDYESFKFLASDQLPYDNLGIWNGDILTYEDPTQGTWTYDKTTGLVNFSPALSFTGKAIIYYTAKGTASLGGPFNQDPYYSVPDEIVVEEIKCGSYVNPQIRSKSDSHLFN